MYILETAGAESPSALVQLCGCCKVVVNWYWVLCHTQYVLNLAWGGRWCGTASLVCLCPIPTSSVQPLGWYWEPSCTGSIAHWCASWRRCKSNHSPRNVVDSSTGRGVTDPDFDLGGGLWTLFGAQWNAQLNIYGLQTWNRALLPIPVWHLLPAIDVFLWYQGSGHVKRSPDHQQSALNIFMAIKDGSSLSFSPKHAKARIQPVGTTFE